MAYYLVNSTSEENVSFNSDISVGDNIGDYLEFRVSSRSGTSRHTLIEAFFNGDGLLIDNGVSLLFRAGSGNPRINVSLPPFGEPFSLKFEKVTTTAWEVFIDDASQGVLETGASAFDFSGIFGGSGFIDFYSLTVFINGQIAHNYNKQALNGSNDTTLPDTVGGNDGTLVNFQTDNSQWVFFDDGGGAVDPEPELHAFSGNATVNALSFAQISKTAQHNGLALVNVSTSGQSAKSVTLSSDSLVTALASASSTKVVNTSGAASIKAQSVSLFEKLNTFSGNATVSTSTQSLLSKIANITGNAITRVTTLAAVLKRVTLSGASRVFATAYGTFFNTESNVDTYELTVQGRVKAQIVVQGTVKSLTIQGRVK